MVAPPRVVGPTLAPGALPAGAVLELKCRRSGQLGWIDVANNSTWYVLKDSKVEFKADSTGGDLALRAMISYQTANWGGTAGAGAGPGATRTITFTANSANAATPSTVTLAFGGQNVQVNVVVFTLNIVSTPLDNFIDRSQTELGVDERVSLSFTTTPAGVTALNARGLRWKFSRGIAPDRATVGLLHNAATHIAPPADNGLADYIAPNRTHPVGEFQTSKVVSLQLSVLDGPSIGLGPELEFRIHKPAAHMTQVPGTLPMHWNPVPGPIPSAGFLGQIYFAPKNVSFRTLRWREGTGVMESSGVLAGDEAGILHASTAHVNAVHGTLGGGDADHGCWVSQQDTVRSAGAYAIPRFNSPTTVVGKKKWPINWEYTYANLDPAAPAGGAVWANDWIQMQIAHHTGTLYENGRFEIFKGHVGCSECMKPISRNLDDGHNWP